MKEAMDHARVSELLRPLALGELTREQAEGVRAHLAGCAECATEYRALELLLTLPAEEPSEIELRGLHARIAEAVESSEGATPSSAPAGASPFRARVAQALGAAALLALIGGVGYLATSLTSSGGDDAGVAGGAGGGQTVDQQVADIGTELLYRTPDADQAGGALGKSDKQPPAPESAEDLTLEQNDQAIADAQEDSGAGAAGAEEADTFGSGGGDGGVALRPLYVRGPGVLRDRTLTLVGRYGLPLVLFPNVYTPADAMDLQTSFLQQLANAAENPQRAESVLECGSAVLARPHPVLPALATFGKLNDRVTLVMAFAWTDAPDGPLDQFMVWSWPRGDCAAAPGYRAGFINR